MPRKDPEAKREYSRQYKEMNREEINARRREKGKRRGNQTEILSRTQRPNQRKTPMPMRRQIHHT